MEKVTLRHSAKEAALVTLALVLFFAFGIAVLCVAVSLAAGGHSGWASVWLLAAIFVILTAGRWLHDRI